MCALVGSDSEIYYNMFINILFTGNCQFKKVVQSYHTVLCAVLSGFDSGSSVGMVLPKQGVASGSAPSLG